jgi:hypothetical protein
MRPELESAAAEVERLTALRDRAAKGSAERRELNHQLIEARRRLLDVEWRRRDRRRCAVAPAVALSLGGSSRRLLVFYPCLPRRGVAESQGGSDLLPGLCAGRVRGGLALQF